MILIQFIKINELIMSFIKIYLHLFVFSHYFEYLHHAVLSILLSFDCISEIMLLDSPFLMNIFIDGNMIKNYLIIFYSIYRRVEDGIKEDDSFFMYYISI
jgi:hypothetical protein